MNAKHPLLLLLIALISLSFLSIIGCDDGGSEDEEDDNQIQAGEPLTDDEDLKLDGVDDPPPLFIDPERPMSGETVTISASFSTAQSMQLTVEGAGCGALSNSTGTNSIDVSGAVAQAGFCKVHVEATHPGGTQIWEGMIDVQASEPRVPPMEIEGAAYLELPPPASSGDPNAPNVTGISGPSNFINGGSADIEISYTSATPLAHAIIQVGGYDGYFLLPVEEVDGPVTFKMRFNKDIMDVLGSRKADQMLNILVGLVNAAGQVGEYLANQMQGTEVSTGDVTISMSWNSASDVDLHVTEPSGETIYYGSKVSSTGGQLDLDSNADCDIDGVNNENIFWPPGESPSGTYSVMVNMYDACETEGASGTVTITYCGEDSPLVDSFSLGTTGSKTWEIDSTCNYTVSGKVTYEDFALKRAGLSAAGSQVPVKFATVQVIRVEDDEILAEGSTDVQGKYLIDFTNDGEHGYFVEVIAAQDNNRLKQEVMDLTGALYSWRSEEEFNETEIPENKDVNFDIKKDELAGALNIWDIGVKGSTYARIYSGKTMPKVEFYWSKGEKPLGKKASFATRDGKIFVLGMDADPDEYDDVVLGHEYGHFVHNSISQNDSPGGRHSSNRQEKPTLSFAEGWATFFGTTVNGVTAYMDTNKNGMGVYYNIETPPATKPLGNKDDKMDGNLSEAIVAAVLMDLYDSSNETNDTVSSLAAWSVMTKYLQKDNGKFKDRGYAKRDLVDFLDGWTCLGFGQRGEDDTKGLRGIVKTIHKLTYDYADVASCE